jgi:UDP-N-acetylmuramoyl-tripeptide--D-alanyl-D-alanine ligase
MACERRKQFSYPVVGVTGSVGKTTTKEMLRSIFKNAKIPACLSHKNQNTLVGLALNMLRMRRDHKIAIFEVGISQKGEMVKKVDLLRPTIGVITTIAHAHMEGLGSITGIAKEKQKLFSFFRPDNIGIILGDQKLLSDLSCPHPVIRFGTRTQNHVQARKITIDPDNSRITFFLKLFQKKKKLILKTNHKGNVYNALAAATVAHLAGLHFSQIVAGLESFKGFEERFEKLSLKSNRGVLISDCYNASPESMRAAIMAVHEMNNSGRKIAVLGDMLELGEKELFWHRQVGRVLGKALSVDHVILVGERAKSIGKTAPLTTKIDSVDNWQQATEKLENLLVESDSLVLVKASHAMKLDRLVEKMTE